MDVELRAAYHGRRVLVTGHTGFKGSWLTLWLRELGAEVTGYALPPETRPALFDVLALGSECSHVVGDLRDLADQIRAQDFDELSITVSHAERAGRLPAHHSDPFDRLLIAQAQAEGLTLVSNEELFDRYGVTRAW